MVSFERDAHFTAPPLRGEWVAVRTPAAAVPSHGTDFFGQRFAYDFCRPLPDRLRFTRASLLRQVYGLVRSKEYLAWDQPVIAAFAGTVVRIGEEWPDQRFCNPLLYRIRRRFISTVVSADEYRPLIGNYVLVKGSIGVALYAHLRAGTVRVAAGAEVRQGQELARIGNSGNTSMPHLHFQLMESESPLLSIGLPCGFIRYDAERNGGWETITNGFPNRFERVRFRES